MPAMTTLSGVFEDEDAASANAVELLAVDWDQVFVGIRQDITVDFSNSAIITDEPARCRSMLSSRTPQSEASCSERPTPSRTRSRG
jgi:hypothetical protein